MAGVYSHVRVLPNEILLKSNRFQKETRRTEREYMTKHLGNYRSSCFSDNILFHSCLDSARKHLKRNLY